MLVCRKYMNISLLWANTFSYNIRFVILDKKAGKAISIDHFDLIRVIGRGSYAKVLMVELKETKRLYAMKVIKKELVTDDEVRKGNNIISWGVENTYPIFCGILSPKYFTFYFRILIGFKLKSMFLKRHQIIHFWLDFTLASKRHLDCFLLLNSYVVVIWCSTCR